MLLQNILRYKILPALLALTCLGFLFCGATISSADPAMVVPHGQNIQLIPFLDYYIDTTQGNDIEEVAALANTSSFKPFVLEDLPKEEGITWLHFILAPETRDIQSEVYLLDMGNNIPGMPLLYIPYKNELSGALEWRSMEPAQRNILIMPKQAAEPLNCYIRISGLPGPWFDPELRTPQNAVSDWSGLAYSGAIIALCMVMLFCLLRGLNENGQWKVWTTLFVAFALLSAVLGLPVFSESFSFKRLFAILSPGLALMVIPHVGRHMMKTPVLSKAIDWQLMLLSFLCAALALLPLVPGFEWLNRWLELWPAAMLVFVPTAIGAWISGLPGAKGFLTACLLAPLFTAFAWYGSQFGFSPSLMSSLPLWGVSFSALIIVSVKLSETAEKTIKKTQKKIVKPGPLDIQEDVINLDHPLDDPSLRFITSPEIPETSQKNSLNESIQPIIEPAGNFISSRESAIRGQLDNLLREGAALGKCSLPAAARDYAEKMITAGENIAKILSNPSEIDNLTEKNAAGQETENFNLQRLIRNVHDSVAPIAENAGLSLSWYMAPSLQYEYRGNSVFLATVLRMLLDSSIRGTNSGSIKLSVRKVPESQDPGHLLFTVSDTGNGAPPLNRSSVALAKTWELASAYKGFMGIESSPEGMTIAFSMHLPVNEQEEEKEDSGQLILAGSDSKHRRELAEIIEATSYKVMEVNTISEAVSRQHNNPVNLLIASDSQAKPAVGDLIQEFVTAGKTAGYKSVHILAITLDESQWPLLKASGFTHAMLEPVDPEAFQYTIAKLVETEKTPEKQEPAATENPAENTGKNENDLVNMMDNFYHRTSDILSANSGQKTGEEIQADSPGEDVENEKSPQDNETKAADDLVNSFEGPEWLNKNPQPKRSADRKSSLENQSEKSAQLNNSNERSSGNDSSFAGQDENTAIIDTEVWVGEPQPVQPFGEKKSDPDEPLTAAGEPAKNSAKKDSLSAAKKVNSSMNDEFSLESDAPKEELRKNDKASTPPLQKEEQLKPVDNEYLEFLDELEDRLKEGQIAFANKNCQMVREATSQMGSLAEKYSNRRIGRLARCVERAAQANDLAAIGDLLPVLADAVEINRISYKSNN